MKPPAKLALFTLLLVDATGLPCTARASKLDACAGPRLFRNPKLLRSTPTAAMLRPGKALDPLILVRHKLVLEDIPKPAVECEVPVETRANSHGKMLKQPISGSFTCLA